MKVVPNIFVRGGFKYEVVGRLKDVAIYKQTDVEENVVVGYEVVIIKHYAKGRKVFGMDVTGHEYLPSPSKWGKDGFSLYAIERAVEKMIQLANRELDKENLKRN